MGRGNLNTALNIHPLHPQGGEGQGEGGKIFVYFAYSQNGFFVPIDSGDEAKKISQNNLCSLVECYRIFQKTLMR
jgi:hypothetical protein